MPESAPPTSQRPEGFGRGLLSGVPIVLAYFPVAVSFGVAASKGGFSLAEALFMSLVIFAGASQFLALALLATAAAPALTIVSLLAMNARHLLYGPALLEALGSPKTTARSWLWSFGLTDEVFAIAVARASRPAASGEGSWSEAWQAGIGLAAYASWAGGTAVGATLGGGVFAAYPALDGALYFLLPALFLSLLLAMLKRELAPVVLVAGASYYLGAAAWSVSTGILLGMLLGGLTATVRHVLSRGRA